MKNIIYNLLFYGILALQSSSVHSDNEINTIFSESEEHEFELTQSLNIQRQDWLQKMCEISGYAGRTINDLSVAQMDHLLIDRKHKFLYCYIPKVSFFRIINFFFDYI